MLSSETTYKRGTKAICQRGWFALVFCFNHETLCNIVFLFDGCECVFVYIRTVKYAKQKTKLRIVEERIAMQTCPPAPNFYAIRILQIVPNLVWYITVFPNICPVISSPKTFRCKHLQAQVFVCVLLWLLSGYDFVIMSLAIKAI